MKAFLAFAFLIAGISATSLQLDTSRMSDERSITGDIESAIRDVSRSIRDAGLDPYHIEEEISSYELRLPNLFNYETILEDILSTGLSDIRIHRLSYSVTRSRLRYDVELPYIVFSAGNAKANAEIFSNKLDVSASGKIEVLGLRVKGVVKVKVRPFSGVNLRWVSAEFTMRNINSDAKVILMGEDISDYFNDFFGNFVPKTIWDHTRDINQMLEHILWGIAYDALN